MKPATFPPSTTRSRSASSKIITGALPPSSRWTRFSVAAAARATSLPVATSPVRGTMFTCGGAPRREGVGRRRGEAYRGEGRLLRWLEDDGVAGGEGRPDLPDRHHQRVVPGGDRGDHADRLPAGAARGVVDVVPR